MKKVVYSNIEFTQNYMITEDGRVFNATRKKFLKEHYDKDGYIDYTLYTTKGRKHFRASRILMSTYCPVDNYENLVVNHLDGNVKNNTLDNLEWCTIRENTMHAYKNGLAHGRKGSKNSQSKLTEQDVLYIRDMVNKKEYTNLAISKMYNVSTATISMIVNKKIWKHI